MSIVFENEQHEKVYRVVKKCLRGLGFAGELLQERYAFNDWFLSAAPEREVCAAFGQTPLSYDSACFAVVPTSTPATPNVIANYRALGAPFALEIREDCVIPWRVGRDAENTSQFAGRIPLNAIEAAFEQRESQWSPDGILRAKNIGLPSAPRQLDFIDLGLIPALEEEISQKLHELLNEALAEAQRVYKQRTGQQPDVRRLFRLVFQLLAGRVLHDRGILGFRSLAEPQDPAVILEKVGNYYGENLPILQDEAAQRAAFERLWTGFSFRNLSVDILAYVYENTLVDPQTREQLGIHSTPRSIARYIVNRLPFENIPRDHRLVVEPCSGHGVFLVSALKRLRDLLPASMDGQERHRYFVKMLRGFEKDEFALEVSRLCLTLADFPNHNGWKIRSADVFTSTKYERALQRARVILCNPPFEDFSKSVSHRHEGVVQKPGAVLKKILKHLPADGLLGFVLPRNFISGKAYREIRHILAQRFDEVEIVALPDRMFRHALLETCLLLGKVPRTGGTSVKIGFSEVKDKDRESFLSAYVVSRTDKGEKSTEQASQSLAVLPLNEVWQRLQALSRLDDVADIHRGVEWKQPFDERKYLSATPKPGFVAGVNSAEGQFRYFERPDRIYLCANPTYRRGNAWDLDWNAPKVAMNAIRVSRGPWRIAAFVDEKELTFSQNFHCLWPKKTWSPKLLAAVLNGPVAAAYVYANEPAKHIRKATLKRLPFPTNFSPEQVGTIERLVDDFLNAVASDATAGLELWRSMGTGPVARRILAQIDAEILRAYNLPPRLERLLLDFFQNEKRPTPVNFGDYFPREFTPTIPFWRFISPDFNQCNGQYLLNSLPKVEDPALIEVLEEVE